MNDLSDEASFLSQAFTVISGRSSDIEEKIQRLNQAKQSIITEQTESMNEIKHIEKPTLDGIWNGERAKKFDDDREEAHQTMKTITDNYDHYVQRIEGEIFQLNAQKGLLDIAGSIAHQADKLLEKGEEVASELGQKINDIKGRLNLW